MLRRLLDVSDAASFTIESVDALFREFREILDWDAAPSVRDSRMRSNLRFFVSMA